MTSNRLGGGLLIVYLDIVILLNFLVDFLLLVGTNRLTGHPSVLYRCLTAAAVGGMYSGLCLLPGMGFLGGWGYCLICFGIIIAIAFGCQKSAIRRGLLFFLLSMALAGIASGLESKNSFLLIIAAIGLVIVCTVGFDDHPGNGKYVNVKLTWKGRNYALIALVDTGNTLKDPISGTQVLVAGPQVAAEVLQLTQMQLHDPVHTIQTANIPGLRLLPYRAVGQAGGMMLGIRMDNVEINGHPAGKVVAFSPVDIGNGEAYQALAGGL